MDMNYMKMHEDKTIFQLAFYFQEISELEWKNPEEIF